MSVWVDFDIWGPGLRTRRGGLVPHVERRGTAKIKKKKKKLAQNVARGHCGGARSGLLM